MIRINLLPTKKLRRELGIRQELLLSGLIFVFIIVVLGLVWMWQSKTMESLTARKNEKQQKLDQIKKVVTEVEQFKKDKELYEQKINIIKDLEAQQSGPVHILDELSVNLPDKIWFESMTLKGNVITVSGSAFANIAIVDFVNNLKRSPYFQNVQLLESKLSDKKDVRVYAYKLSANMSVPKK
ncbi:MAG: PilN domain-containing protein [bacterium]